MLSKQTDTFLICIILRAIFTALTAYALEDIFITHSVTYWTSQPYTMLRHRLLHIYPAYHMYHARVWHAAFACCTSELLLNTTPSRPCIALHENPNYAHMLGSFWLECYGVPRCCCGRVPTDGHMFICAFRFVTRSRINCLMYSTRRTSSPASSRTSSHRRHVMRACAVTREMNHPHERMHKHRMFYIY